MKISYCLIFIISAFIVACGGRSEEDLKALEEAQRIHNEAMATFSETRELMDEMTEAKARLARKLGMETSAGTTTASDSLINSEDLVPENMDNEPVNTEATNSAQQQQQNSQQSSENQAGNQSSNQQKSDTTQMAEPRQALEKLNEAQAGLLDWMRNIYKVPNNGGIYEDEKAGEKPAIGLDFDSDMLLTDMEFKEYPEGTSPEEILKSQKKMREEISKIQEDLKKAIAEARKAVI